jgi:hypothetical protein
MEHLSVGLKNPSDSPGGPGLINFFHNVYGDTYAGNLKSDLWIPWVGLQVREDRLNGSLRFSPVANTSVKAPFNYTFVAIPGSLAVLAFDQDQYRFRNNGFWLESNLSYDLYKTSKWRFSAWSTGSWLWARGGVNNDYQSVGYLPGIPPINLAAGSTYAHGSYLVGNYGLGLRLAYSF